MTESGLEQSLQKVTDRLYKLRVLRWQTLFWLILLVPAVIAVRSIPQLDGLIGTPVIVVLIATIIGLLWTRRQAQRPSKLETARVIESRRPELNDALISAVTAAQKQQQTPSVLNEWAIEEADQLARESDWRGVVSFGRMSTWSLASLVTFGMLITSVWSAAKWTPTIASRQPTESTGNANTTRMLADLVVEPGNTEIERDTALTVVARFGRDVPERAELEVTTGDQVVRQPMLSTVDDGVFAARIRSVTADSEYRIRFGARESADLADAESTGETSPKYRISTYVRPAVEQIDVLVQTPDYVKQSQTLIQDTQRITVVEGSQVDIRLKLNQPVEVAELMADTGEIYSLDPLTTPTIDDPNQPQLADSSKNTTVDRGYWYHAKVDAEQDTVFQIYLQDTAGREAADPPSLTMKVTRNLRPTVKMTFPGQDTNVSALQEFYVEAEVSDDFGLQQVGVTYSLDGGELQEVVLSTVDETKPISSLTVDHTFLLEELKAEPDQLLTYSFFVTDYDTDGNLRRTDGDLMLTEVRRFEEIFRQGQQQSNPQNQRQQQQNQRQQGQQGTAEQLLKLQREILVATWNVRRRTHQLSAKTDAEVVRDSQRSAIEMLEESLQTIDDPELKEIAEQAQSQMQSSALTLDLFVQESASESDADNLAAAIRHQQSVVALLMKMRSREHEVQRSRQQNQGQQQGQQSSSQQQLRQLELKNEQRRYESEQQVQQQNQETEDDRLQRQVLNRLKELARRQQMLNERMKQLQSELRTAKTEAEKQEIQRELKRLRDEQRDNLRDVDEMLQTMDQQSSEQRQQNQQTRQQAEQAREQVQQATRAMDEGNLSKAISEGTRAERQFEQMQEQIRQQTSSQFSEAMQDLRQQVRQMQQRQQDLANAINPHQQPNQNEQKSQSSQQSQSDQNQPLNQQAESNQRQNPSLRTERDREQIRRDIQQQQDDLEKVLQQAREIVEQAEESEPLLSRRLYDTVREARKNPTSEAFDAMETLVSRGQWQQSQEAEQVARAGIDKLTEQIEQAADAVLGSQTQALRRAQSELKDLTEQLSAEVQERRRNQSEESDAESQNDRPQQTAQQSDKQREAQPTTDAQQPTAQRPASQDSSQQNQAAQNAQGESQNQQGANQQNSGQQSQNQQNSNQRSPATQASPSSSFLRNGGADSVNGRSQQTSEGRPLTGDNYRQWSNRMRELEETLEDDELRHQVAQVRDRARAMRAEFRRHGTEPQWDLVQSQMLDQMLDLQKRIDQQLRQLDPNQNSAPIDREPVPVEFDELVRRYYELLGRQRQESD